MNLERLATELIERDDVRKGDAETRAARIARARAAKQRKHVRRMKARLILENDRLATAQGKLTA